jgi:hypothetical protein
MNLADYDKAIREHPYWGFLAATVFLILGISAFFGDLKQLLTSFQPYMNAIALTLIALGVVLFCHVAWVIRTQANPILHLSLPPPPASSEVEPEPTAAVEAPPLAVSTKTLRALQPRFQRTMSPDAVMHFHDVSFPFTNHTGQIVRDIVAQLIFSNSERKELFRADYGSNSRHLCLTTRARDVFHFAFSVPLIFAIVARDFHGFASSRSLYISPL